MSPKKTTVAFSFEHAHANPHTHTHRHRPTHRVYLQGISVMTEVSSVSIKPTVKQKKEHIRIWDVFCLAEGGIFRTSTLLPLRSTGHEFRQVQHNPYKGEQLQHRKRFTFQTTLHRQEMKLPKRRLTFM